MPSLYPHHVENEKVLFRFLLFGTHSHGAYSQDDPRSPIIVDLMLCFRAIFFPQRKGGVLPQHPARGTELHPKLPCCCALFMLFLTHGVFVASWTLQLNDGRPRVGEMIH